MEKRKHLRFNKRLATKIIADQISFTCMTSDLSENGLFIRTGSSFTVNTPIDIQLLIPGYRVSFLKGIVRRTIRTPIPMMKNGMGIEIIEKDASYIHFLKPLIGETEKSAVEESAVLCSQISASSTDQGANKDLSDIKWDKRQWQRYAVDDGEIAVMIGSSDEAKVVDISTGGISFKTEIRLDHNKQYVIKLNRKDSFLALHGVIKWVSLNEYTKLCSQSELVPKYTIGMQFTDLLGNTSNEVVQFLDGLPKRDAVNDRNEPVDLSEFILSECIEPEEAPGETKYKKTKSSQDKRNKSTGEKRKSAFFCGSKERSNLLRDPNKDVVLSVLENPKTTETEIAQFAKLHSMPGEAIKKIIQNKAWMNHYGIVSALVNNPKTPPFIAATLANKLKKKDLRKLERNRGVCELVRSAAKKLLSHNV
ncbi:MAG: PilZ domain-containing protein [Thermodesulfovibrionales bacterium]